MLAIRKVGDLVRMTRGGESCGIQLKELGTTKVLMRLPANSPLQSELPSCSGGPARKFQKWLKSW